MTVADPDQKTGNAAGNDGQEDNERDPHNDGHVNSIGRPTPSRACCWFRVISGCCWSRNPTLKRGSRTSCPRAIGGGLRDVRGYRWLAMSGAGEEPLPLYGLPGSWPGERRRRSHGGGERGSDVLNRWSSSHCVPGSDGEIVVCSQRRAIHGAGSAGSPRVTGPVHLVKADAALAVILAANETKLQALRESGGHVRPPVKELWEAAQRVALDTAAWRPAELLLDGVAADAIETSYEGWWLVLHIGVHGIADIYVYGPPRARPEPLVLQRVSDKDHPDSDPEHELTA